MLQSSAESHIPVTLTNLGHLYSLHPVPQFQLLPHFLTPQDPIIKCPLLREPPRPFSSLLSLETLLCGALFLPILPAKLRKDFFFHQTNY